MIRSTCAAFSALLLLVGFGAPAVAADPRPPIAAYGALPAVSNVTLSADGSRLAFVGVAGEERRLIMQTVSGEVLGVITLGKINVEQLVWAGNDDIVILNSVVRSHPELGGGKISYWVGQSFSLSKKRFINLAGRVPTALSVIFDGPPRRELARIAVKDGTAVTVASAAMDGLGWLVNAEGHPGGSARYTENRGYWGAQMPRGSVWADVFTVKAPLDSPQLVAFSGDGQRLVIGVTDPGGDRYIEVGRDGEPRDALPANQPFNGLVVDPATSRMLGHYYIDDSSQYVFSDPAAKAAWASVMKTFKGQRVLLQSWSADWRKVAVLVEGKGNSGIYYLVDLSAKRADFIGETYPTIVGDAVAETRPYSFKAADGLDIPGYLTLPPGREAKGLPLVVLPHGGPADRDMLEFDFQAQALASRGYAVLRPNFRGSSGYGQAFMAAGYGQWGRKMQTDLSDGVRALAREGVIDPKRVCIVGWSYGGYAAMAGITLDPGVYRCAVAGAGVSDLKRFSAWRARRSGENSEAVRSWNRFWGSEDEKDPVLEAISPARHADKAYAPILLIHGKDDTVVPYEQSVMFADALKSAGKSVEMVTLKGEDHNLSRADTRLQTLEATVAFLLKHNPPD